MTQIVFFLEEESARELLKGLLPHIVPGDVHAHYLVFEGKQDLERQLTRKLKGWRAPNSIFVVMRDQDGAECEDVKLRLTHLVDQSTRTALVRIACRELEAWVAGDLEALAAAYERPGIADHRRKARFREPDTLVKPIEALRQLAPEYQKVDGARRLGPLLDPLRNASPSFQAFCVGVQRLVASQTRSQDK